VTAAPYAGATQITLEPELIYSKRKGAPAEVVATYDAAFRAAFDRKITDWAIDFMGRAKAAGKPFYVYLPYTQVHIPPIPDPEYAGKTKRGNWADLLVRMDDFTGRILDTLDALGLAQDTIVVWASDNGPDPDYRYPAGDPDPFGGQWSGFSGPWRGGLFTSLEGSNRTPCIIRWPGKTPAGKVSNELVHEVDLFTTLVLAAGARVPDDRMIDGMDMRAFLLGAAEESGRDAILCFQATRLQAVKWRQWKAHLLKQDEMFSTWAAYNMPHIHNLEWDPRELHEVGLAHAWVLHPMAAAVAAFMKTLVAEPPIMPGTPDPYAPPKPGSLRAEEHIQLGAITQFVTTLVKAAQESPTIHTGLEGHRGAERRPYAHRPQHDRFPSSLRRKEQGGRLLPPSVPGSPLPSKGARRTTASLAGLGGSGLPGPGITGCPHPPAATGSGIAGSPLPRQPPAPAQPAPPSPSRGEGDGGIGVRAPLNPDARPRPIALYSRRPASRTESARAPGQCTPPRLTTEDTCATPTSFTVSPIRLAFGWTYTRQLWSSSASQSQSRPGNPRPG
jgi:arylsulfatase